MKNINVLIMAVGSPLGQSIYKALLKSKLPLKLFLADISELAAGFYLKKDSTKIILPLVKDKNYFRQLKKNLKKYHINVIFPVISLEHQFFSEHIDYFNQENIEIVTTGQKQFELCDNKYKSMIFLKNKGIKVPETVLAEDNAELRRFLKNNHYPVLIKPVSSASSSDVFTIKDRPALMALIKAYPKNYFVAQEYLKSPEEYTVGVYISRDKSFQDTFIIKRELKFGLSYKGEVMQDEKISNYCLEVCRVLETLYSANVQLKVVNSIPYAFEINPRLSSTTVVRAHYGYNEPEMILVELFGNLKKYKYRVRKGKFMRYWEEVYLK